MTSRNADQARAVAEVAKSFNVSIMGLAGTCHQQVAKELGIPFIAGKENELIPGALLILFS